eukprot:1258307-Rhodomonas_salina.1
MCRADVASGSGPGHDRADHRGSDAGIREGVCRGPQVRRGTPHLSDASLAIASGAFPATPKQHV